MATVAVVAPQAADNHAGLDLPGRLEAYIRAPIYARVSGYLKSWQYDIGAKVKSGSVLAEIDTPDLDQQLSQARADLNVSQANAHLAQISATRWQSLAGTDAVATQDIDQRTYSLNANLAQVKASQANVDRLVAEEGFKRLVAPFRRRRHGARDRYRRTDQCRCLGRCGTVRRIRDGQTAHLHQCSAELRSERAVGDPRDDFGA